jgi:hypothetical protein
MRSSHKLQRAERFSRGVFGKPGRANITPVPGFSIVDPPDYETSRRAALRGKADLFASDRDDWRCFFTGVLCDTSPVPVGEQRAATQIPFQLTRDHLVPVRRGVALLANAPKPPSDRNRRDLVVASAIVNETLRDAPLLVRLKLRDWLMTVPFDRNDRSIAMGENIRWLVVEMLSHFKYRGFLMWSRKHEASGDRWWFPDLQAPFMERMFDAERQFLALNVEERCQFIKNNDWLF